MVLSQFTRGHTEQQDRIARHVALAEEHRAISRQIAAVPAHLDDAEFNQRLNALEARSNEIWRQLREMQRHP